MMWSEKYRPNNFLDLIGNEESRKLFVEWFTNWRKGIKPILLVGPPGIGKTTLANLAAKQFGYDLISLNASDVRNKKNINDILNPVLVYSYILNPVCNILQKKLKDFILLVFGAQSSVLDVQTHF